MAVPQGAPGALTGGYEALRAERPGLGAGYALFVSRGAAAWMRVWAASAPPPEAARWAPPPARGPIAPGARQELVSVLAGMVFRQMEGTS